VSEEQEGGRNRGRKRKLFEGEEHRPEMRVEIYAGNAEAEAKSITGQ